MKKLAKLFCFKNKIDQSKAYILPQIYHRSDLWYDFLIDLYVNNKTYNLIKKDNLIKNFNWINIVCSDNISDIHISLDLILHNSEKVKWIEVEEIKKMKFQKFQKERKKEVRYFISHYLSNMRYKISWSLNRWDWHFSSDLDIDFLFIPWIDEKIRKLKIIAWYFWIKLDTFIVSKENFNI